MHIKEKHKLVKFFYSNLQKYLESDSEDGTFESGFTCGVMIILQDFYKEFRGSFSAKQKVQIDMMYSMLENENGGCAIPASGGASGFRATTG